MLIKLLQTIVIIFLLFFQNSLYSKNKDSNYLSSKNLAEYLSAIISYDNGENTKSLEFFDKSKLLIDEHNPYLKKYIFSLITEGKINKAISRLKKKDKDDEAKGTQLPAGDERELRQLNLAKTLSKFNEGKLAKRIFEKLRK